MNAFNRGVTILLIAVLLVISIWAAVFPEPLVGWAVQSLDNLRGNLAYWESNYRVVYVALRLALVVVAVFVLGVLLFLELRRSRPKTVQVVTGEGSSATVITSSVAQRLVHHIDRLADVISVVPKVTGRGSTVHVDLELETGPEIVVPMKTEEVVAVAREVVEEHMGLLLGKITVRIRHAAYPE